MEKFKKLHQKGIVQWTVLAFIITFIIEVLSKRSLLKTVVFLCRNPLVFLFNMLIIMIPLGIGFFFKRKYFALSCISAVLLILGIANFVILSNRVTPFCPTDLLLISDALKVMNNYISWYMIIGIIAGLVVVIAGLVILFKKVPKYEYNLTLTKRIGIWVALIFVVLIYNEVGRMSGLIPKTFSNIADAYQNYGFACCFSYGIFDTGISKPSSYGSELVDEIIEEVQAEITESKNLTETIESVVETTVETVEETQQIAEETQELEKAGFDATTPNIIFIQLESFFDLSEMTNITLNEDPIPYFHELMSEYTSGYLYVPVIGAGTANTEFEVITGMDLDFFGPGEYPYKTVLKTTTAESMCYDVKPLGYVTHAIHNNTATFYSRDTVFPQLGFDTFTSSEYMQNVEFNEIGWIKDKVLTDEIIKALQSTDTQDLIYTISVQGHGAYPTENILENTEIEVSGYEDEGTNNAFTYYANQIHQMDEFVKELTQALEANGEPTVLVMYGDHLPTLGIEQSMIGDRSLFETPCVVWDNIGLEKQELSCEAFQLSAYVFERLGIHEGVMTKCHQAYFAGLREENNSNSTVVSEVEIDENSVKAEYLNSLEILEYDILYGEMESLGGENPYTPTNMLMGVEDIVIDSVSYRDKTLYVKGENFTLNSTVYIDREQVETQYASNHLLIVHNYEPQDGQLIYVGQYAGKDKKLLSKTASYEIRTSVSVKLKTPEVSSEE